MKISNAFPSKYLKASDLQDRNVHVVMARVELEDIGDAERKPVLHFQSKAKGLVLNKTNSRAITAAYGDDTENWEGKPLFPAMVDFRGERRSHSREGAAEPSGAAEVVCAAGNGKSGGRSR
jgi:hypothetical protein